jgi:hypothetical protein
VEVEMLLPDSDQPEQDEDRAADPGNPVALWNDASAASTATVAPTRTRAAVRSSMTDLVNELPSTAIVSMSASSCTASRRRCSL